MSSAQQEARAAIYDKAWKSKLDEIRERPRGAAVIPYEAHNAGLDALWSAAIDAAAKAIERELIYHAGWSDMTVNRANALLAIRALDATPTTENGRTS